MVERCPLPSITNLYRWEIDRVEVHIILSHELVELNILGVEPPLPPLRCEIRSDADIAYACFELHTIDLCVMVKKDANLPIHLERVVRTC